MEPKLTLLQNYKKLAILNVNNDFGEGGKNALKNVIKNKPEYSAKVGDIIGGVMHIVETNKSGNNTSRNITRLS